MDHPKRVLTVSVGNTRTRAGVFDSGRLVESVAFPGSIEGEARDALARLVSTGDAPSACALASVNDPVAERVSRVAAGLLGGQTPLRLGRDILIPVRHSLDDASTVGQDRWLNALGAYSRAGQACVIVDIGTAVTVDFIDGEGVFHGGVIFPGLNLMLRALHEGTAALPTMSFSPPDPGRGGLGKDTAHAMTLGVLAAVRGGVRAQVERIADFYGAYPQIVATGGDASVLEEEEIVEHFVPDLQLIGLYECVVRGLEDGE